MWSSHIGYKTERRSASFRTEDFAQRKIANASKRSARRRVLLGSTAAVFCGVVGLGSLGFKAGKIDSALASKNDLELEEIQAPVIANEAPEIFSKPTNSSSQAKSSLAKAIVVPKQEGETVLTKLIEGRAKLKKPAKLVEPSVVEKLEEPADRTHTVEHIVSSGDTFSAILGKHGISPASATSLSKALRTLGKKEIHVSQNIQIGTKISLKIDGENLVAATLQEEPGRLVRFSALSNTNNDFIAKLYNLPREDREILVAGVIETSFAEAANKEGLNPELVDNIVDLFSNRIEFGKDFRVGDSFSVLFQREFLIDGTPLEKGEVVAALINVRGKKMAAIRYVGNDGKIRYFDEDGKILGNSFLRYPVRYSRISSHFSYSRFHPILKRRVPHHGVDFAAPTGTPVRSVASGKVLFASRKGANGLFVKIRHSSRYTTSYSHLSRINKNVTVGSTVEQGQVIGAVGATGRATGPHLHFSFYDNGKYVDPLKIKLPIADKLKKGQKIDANFLRRIKRKLESYILQKV